MICYLFAGFLGIACGLFGIMSTPILLMTINIFGGAAVEGNVLAKVWKKYIKIRQDFCILNL